MADTTWQVDALWVLAWSVHIHDQLDFGEDIPDHFVKMLPDLHAMESTHAIRESTRLRARPEILQMADLAYCLHWAIVDASINHRPNPGRVHVYSVIMRRRALEWLLSTDDWEHVQMDT